jgi:hypothetical protein
MADRRERAEDVEPARRDGWATHEAEQRRAWQRTTARERLAWLEDAKRFVLAARKAAARRGEGDRGRS